MSAEFQERHAVDAAGLGDEFTRGNIAQGPFGQVTAALPLLKFECSGAGMH